MGTNLTVLLTPAGEFGYTVAIVGFSIVVTSLTLLILIFSQLPRVINLSMKRKEKKAGKATVKDEKQDHGIEGNVTAAISVALHLYFSDLHDEESNIVTIKKVKRAYSPWSSKIYSVYNNWPQK